MTCEGFYNQAEMTLECGITIMNHTTTNENEFDRFLMRANRLYFHLYFFIKMTEVLQVPIKSHFLSLYSTSRREINRLYFIYITNITMKLYVKNTF